MERIKSRNLEMIFFVPSNTFLRVVKLHIFGNKILGTLEML